MEIWLIAATAATGYIAKQLQNVTKGKDNILESSSEDVKPESPPRCLLSRFARVMNKNENMLRDEKMISDGENPEAHRVDVPPSTSEENLDHHSDSLSGLMPEFPEIEHGNWKTIDTELNSSFRQRRFIRRNQRYRRLTKPLSSLESCLMSRFHGEQMTMEDYMTSPFPSPVSRPLLVTDGSRVISKSTADSLWLSQHTILSEEKAANSCRSLGLKSLVERGVGIEKSKSRKHGLSDATVLLQIGISIGIMSSYMASQAEVSRVKQELKQTENLVHDFEDELEMKDSLVVQEVDVEKAADHSESISNIEAELEAELERLEINMNSSNIETRLSDMFEMEPGFEVEFAQGELRTDRVKGKRLDETESNQDPSGNGTPESGNYAVSPRELSLRLHKVINSRLEKRITELETALQESQKKVEQLVMESESKKKNSWSRLWETREVMTYKSDSKVPVAIEHTKSNNLAEMQPLVMNLTGEALDAFNDSYDELMKINDDSEDDDDSPLEMQESGLHQEDFSSTNKSSPWSHHKDDSMLQEQELLDLIGLEEEDGEGSSDFESEMEKQLIKQIVEKTKQGSPVVLNAQKMLFLMEETEQNL
uniref:Protein POLAR LOCALIZATION DURING ASYMMETRIC DIVISION AND REDISTRIBUTION n=1 Tax=Noccaea caerulescens TaxID=107243 RepID=A0A1J3D142_NOCCA